jgi:hypothetical protein
VWSEGCEARPPQNFGRQSPASSLVLLHFIRFFLAGTLKLAPLVCLLASLQAVSAGVARPKLLWQGELHGIQDLVVHGNRVEVERQSGAEISKITYRFLTPLPELDVEASLHLLRSRGYVHIVQQPEYDNGYALRVRIEDRQDGTYLYRLMIDWPDSDVHGQKSIKTLAEKPKKPKHQVLTGERWGGADTPEAGISCRRIWQGDLEGTVQLAVSDQGVQVIGGTAKDVGQVEGLAEPEGHPRPLKEAKSVAVISLSPDVITRIVETPGRENAYTFKVEVSGADGPVSLELAW